MSNQSTQLSMQFLNNISKIIFLFLFLIGTVLYFSNFKNPQEEHVSTGYQSPSQISFCGTNVPLEDNLVYESFDRELLVNLYWQSRTIFTIKRANKYFPIIEPILDSMGIPNDFKYLAVIESGLMNVGSPAGARGFWQFLENTAKEHGLEVSETVDERLNVYKSTVAACQYLKKSYAHLGDWSLCAASYNMGLSGIKSVIESQKQRDYYKLHLNEETGRYVYRIIATKYIFENAEVLGLDWQGMRKYENPTLKQICIDSSITDLRQFCTSNNYSYKELKSYNPWLISTKFTPIKGKTYTIELPQ